MVAVQIQCGYWDGKVLTNNSSTLAAKLKRLMALSAVTSSLTRSRCDFVRR